MKKNKFKKMRLQIQTLEDVERKDTCAVLLERIQMELPEVVKLSMETTQQSRVLMEDGTLFLELNASGIRSDGAEVGHLRTGKQAEILDYNYFKSRLAAAVITDVRAEVFDFTRKRKIPFSVKKLEFSFANGKKLDFTDKVSVLSLDRLAS